MHSSVRTYHHKWPHWDVYPRVHYFYRRYKDLLARYKKVTELLPKCFQVDIAEVILDLDEIRDYFENGIQVNVIGTDVIEDNLVFHTPEKTFVEKGSPAVVVSICHADIEQLDLEGLEVFNALGRALVKESLIDGKLIFISCGINNNYPEEKIDEFKAAILTTLQDNGVSVSLENILIGHNTSYLRAKISDELEYKITGGFNKIAAHLERLDFSDIESPSTENSILENEAVEESITGFLQNPYNFVEIICEKTETEDFLDKAVFRVSQMVKCAVVCPLARKHKLKLWICNELLHEIDFHQALCNSVSKIARHHLKKLEVYAKSKSKLYHSHSLVYLLQRDMRNVVEKAEEQLRSMECLTMTMRRLLLETTGYIKQSDVTKVAEIEMMTINRLTKVSEQLRRDILKIPGVYGLGNFYGKLEIHVIEGRKQETKMETDTSDDSEYPDDKVEDYCKSLKFKIATELRKHNFYFPYAIQYLRNEAQEMNGCFEPGETLLCQTNSKGKQVFKKGTLGTFVKSKNGKVYGLTCAHVVSGTRRVFVERADGRHPLSVSYHTVQTSQDECRLIDIGALEVICHLQSTCKDSLETNVGRVAKAMLEKGDPKNLIGRYVHKVGAESGLTQGIIMTIDYSRFGPNAEDYIMIVDPLAASNPEDLDGLVGAFKSLLEITPQEEGGQQNEPVNEEINSNTNTEASSEAVGGHVSIYTRENKDVDGSHHPSPKRRKIETNDIVLNAKRTFDVTHSDMNIDQESEFSAERNRVIATDARVVSPANENIDTSNQFKIRLSSRNNNTRTGNLLNIRDHSVLYVRDIKESEIERCKIKASSVFAEKGDSGSAICTRNLSHDGPTYFAIAMLSAGDLEIDGHSGKKALSFMLKDGLAKLQKHCNIEF